MPAAALRVLVGGVQPAREACRLGRRADGPRPPRFRWKPRYVSRGRAIEDR